MSGGKTTTENSMWGPQQGNVQAGMDSLAQMWAQGAGRGFGGLGHHGIASPGMSGSMQRGVGMAGQMAGQDFGIQNYGQQMLGMGNVDLSGAQGSANQMMGGLGLGMAGLGQTAAGGFLNSNPYLQGAIGAATAPMIDAYNQQIAPGLDATFGGAGRGGSGLHMNAQLQAGQNLQRNIGDVANQMSSANFQSERDRMMGAQNALTGLANQGIGQLGNLQGLALQGQGLGLGALDQLFGMQNQNLQNLFNAGNVEDAFAMRSRQDQIDAFRNQLMATQNLLGLSGTLGQYNNTSTQQTEMGAADIFKTLLGGGMSALGAFMGKPPSGG